MQSQYNNLVENTYLVSPISGVVTARNYDPGDMTSTLPILTIEQIHPVKVIVNISEAEYSKVKKGMKAGVRLDVYPDEEFTGTVYLIHPSIDPSTRTFTVEITIDNPGDRVLPGMFARVKMLFGTTEHVVVPDRAVVKQTGSGKRFVYVYNPSDSAVSYIPVELGQRLNDRYEIVNGIEPGSVVVVTGQTRLRDGMRVRPIKKKQLSTSPPKIVYEPLCKCGKATCNDSPMLCGCGDYRPLLPLKITNRPLSGCRDQHHNGDDHISGCERPGHRAECDTSA